MSPECCQCPTALCEYTGGRFFTWICACLFVIAVVVVYVLMVFCRYCGRNHKQFVYLMMSSQTGSHAGVHGEVFRFSWPQVNSEPN